MVLLRTAALRRPLAQQLSSGMKSSARTAGRPAWRQAAGRRGYASSHGSVKDEGSDLPWAIGAVVVTIPSVWYLLQPKGDAHGSGDHGKHGASHHEEKQAEAQETEKEEPSKDEEKSDDSAEKKDGGDEAAAEKSDDAPKEESDGEQKEAEAKDDEAEDGKKQTTEEAGKASESGDVAFKGPGKSTKDDERKKEPSPKSDSGEKKRIDSAQRKPQGTAGEEAPDSPSNAPTMHSTDQMKNPDQSKKSEGAPDTAKVSKPVDPKR